MILIHTIRRAVPALLLTMPLILTADSPAGAGSLPGIQGHKPDKWEKEPNWTHAKGNPWEQDGLTWTLAAQEEPEPWSEAPFTLMKPGTYVDYYFIWQTGPKVKDPVHQYRDKKLITRPNGNTPQHSPASAILVKPAKTGTYKLTVRGDIIVKQPSAGYGRVTVYTLGADRKNPTEVATFKLNSGDSGSYGSFPADMELVKDVDIPEDGELVLRVQGVNPGPATCGTVMLNISEFTLELQK